LAYQQKFSPQKENNLKLKLLEIGLGKRCPVSGKPRTENRKPRTFLWPRCR